MKRVEAININGIVFSIDDDAYGKLRTYLDALSRYFEDEQGGREIITDIEARIAELFTERYGGATQVVAITDVTRVIETLGSPEDIAGADVEPGDVTPASQAQMKKPPRHLYRDPDRRYLGGVCAGIAAWIGISPAVVRIAFIVATFFYGLSLLIYCVLWIIIPKAKTTAQKLEMYGQAVTISNIEKNIKESFSDPSLKQSFRNFLNEAGEFLSKVFGVLWRIVCILVGAFLCFIGIILGVATGSLFFMQDIAFKHEVDWDFLSFNELFQHIISPASYCIIMVCVVVVLVLLVFACLYWGIKLISGFKVRHKLVHVVLSVVWIAAIVTGVIVCMSEVRNYTWHNELAETKQIAPTDTLYLATEMSQMKLSNNPLDVYYDKINSCFYGKPNLRIHKSDDGRIRLEIERESQGESRLAAYQYAESIVYNYEIRDSLLTFAPHFTVAPQNQWKFQTLELVLYVPAGTVIVADKALCNDRILGRWLRWQSNDDCTWVMTDDDGLQSLDWKKE